MQRFLFFLSFFCVLIFGYFHQFGSAFALDRNLSLAPDEQSRLVHKLAELPEKWRDSVTADHKCAITDEYLSGRPIQVLAAEKDLLVLVPCPGIVERTQVFIEYWTRPALPVKLLFATPASPRGFVTTDLLGQVEWSEDTAQLTSAACSDLLSDGCGRITHTRIYSNFTLTRVEYSHGPEQPWHRVWDAPEWHRK